ncbi:cobaltochelatase subunit CobN [Oleomonas cavernae]|uniref:Cobaltochelatase subunit CobN n=1 Tax=Oleomonas cavernae TaxID=2320859 RepID=A0A418WE16_9PROT|nr:cobaltochelatase subunit CobN [Oleomonas cavernae]RJF88248.1 cobaltochelatase subunit CobN [Oleomonas cavernae]
MHILVRETHGLDEADAAVDLDHAPADLLFLSFTDSDLAAFVGTPVQTASLARLRHPLSVDLYLEKTAAHARAIVVRLLGGLDYWRYGAEELAGLARKRGVALVLIPGDGRPDERLAALSTAPAEIVDKLDGCFRHGGAANMRLAVELMAYLGGRGEMPAGEPAPLPLCGELPLPPVIPAKAGIHSGAARDVAMDSGLRRNDGWVAIVFYRAHLLADDIAPIHALAAALRARGLGVRAYYVASLKDATCTAFIAGHLRDTRPAVIVNATAFSARLDNQASPLDAAGVPVLQVTLAGSTKPAWAASARGLAQSDLAMQVVLPELDGRLLAGSISFKEEAGARTIHAPDADGIALVADRAVGWARLGRRAREERRLALVLSDYPGAAGQVAHAVGLDAIASTASILRLLHEAGYDTHEAELVEPLTQDPPQAILNLDDYRRLFAMLPQTAQARVLAAWGEPTEAELTCRFARLGNVIVAIQPDRGRSAQRKATFHDPDLPPRHAYVAFYLWLRLVERIDAMIHLGTHGTLEWLPGKAVALSPACYPAALVGGLPVIYPFIVNNPGEAAAAKRRLGAVTIGHLTPPLRAAGSHGAVTELDRLVDEFAAADGLDRRRTAILKREILDRAGATGLLEESGVTREMDEDTALARLDAYLCDVKDLQIREGLHIFGQAPTPERRESLLDALIRSCPGSDREALGADLDRSAPGEAAALLAALDGRFIAPGPAGAPTRGRADVLPTGRNLYAIDPRAVPSRSALVLAQKAAEDLLRRHLQDHGDWPRSLVLDLWGSATMRTGGEELALALVLMGARPVWDHGSARVTGIEILTIAEIDRPRVDVTLRISGLFRDAFEAQITLFDQAVQAIARRDETAEWNPLAALTRDLDGDDFRRATTRIYGAAPGAYGSGVTQRVEHGDWQTRADLGRDYLAASTAAFGRDLDGTADAAGFAQRVAGADGFVHVHDNPEIDIFESLDVAVHAGGFAAAAASLGNVPALYHADTTAPDTPKTRGVIEEVTRIVRGRAANPAWIVGMMAHGYRGAAEIARTVEPLFAFAATLPDRLDRQFDLLFDATIGDERVDGFLNSANPDARRAMEQRFAEAVRRGLWQPRRNAVAARLGGAA